MVFIPSGVLHIIAMSSANKQCHLFVDQSHVNFAEIIQDLHQNVKIIEETLPPLDI